MNYEESRAYIRTAELKKRDRSGTGKYEGADEAAWKSPG